MKSIEQLRAVCSHVGALVVPNAISIANVQQAFAPDGRITDAGVEESLEGLAESLLAFMRAYVYPRHVLEEAVRSGSLVKNEPWVAAV